MKKTRNRNPIRLTDDEVEHLRRLLKLGPDDLAKQRHRHGRRSKKNELPAWVEEYFQ